MAEVSKIIGASIADISSIKGIAKANVALIGGAILGGSNPISTKAIVYDGVDATSTVVSSHIHSQILYNSTNDAATFSIWVNMQEVTDTDPQYIFGDIFSQGGGGHENTLTIKRESSSNPSNIIVRTNNFSVDPKLGITGAFRKEVETTTGVTNDWIHICLVVSESAAATSYDTSIFINGSPASDTLTTLTYTPDLSLVRNNLGLGSVFDITVNDTSQFSEMKLSDYIVWDDELTSSEITEIYNAGVGGFDPSTNSGNYVSSTNLKIHYEVGNDAEDTTEAPVTNNTGITANLVHTNVEFEAL